MRKLKLRLPNQEQCVNEAYAFIVVFTVVGASMLFFSVFVFFWHDNFVFIYLLIFFFVQTSISAAILCSFIRLSIFSIIFIIKFEDINECLEMLHTCSPHAFCNNTKGAYNCTCKHGLTGNGRECKGKRWGRNIEENQLVKSISKNFATLTVALPFHKALRPL